MLTWVKTVATAIKPTVKVVGKIAQGVTLVTGLMDICYTVGDWFGGNNKPTADTENVIEAEVTETPTETPDLGFTAEIVEE